MEEKEKCCLTCMHEALPQGLDPCNKCIGHDEWKPKDAEPVVGIDPGAPEGDQTNVRLDWGESGPELIGPPRASAPINKRRVERTEYYAVMDKDKFYQEMEKELEKRNMSQRELAKKVGIPASTLQTMIERKADVKVGIYHRICRELELYPRPWPLDGREINENLFKDGYLVETAKGLAKQITRLDYAIAGVRTKIGSIGIKFTDKDLSRDEIDFMVGQLNALQLDLFELEEERERKLRGAADVEIKDRDS